MVPPSNAAPSPDDLREPLRGLPHRINDAELVVAPDGRIVDANDRASELYGDSLEALLALHITDLRAVETHADIARHMAEAAAADGARFETIHRRRDGSTFPVEISVRPLDVAGQRCLRGLVRDLTNQRRQEAESQLLASITRSMTDTVFVTDLDHRLVRSVTTDETLLGYAPDEFMGMHPLERFEIEFPDEGWPEQLDRLLRRESARSHVRVKRKDGTRMDADATVTVLLDAAGEANGFVTILRDITAQKDAERALQKSEAQLRATLATMAEGVVVQNASGHIVTCNAAAERILGLTRQQLEGLTSLDPRWRAVHEDERPFPGEEHPAAVTLRTGEPQSGVVMGVHLPDDSLRWILISTEPLQIEGTAERLGVVATFTDITERQRMMRALETLRARLAFALDGADDGVWDWNVETGHVEFSPRWAEMAGYTVDELEPHVGAWERMVHPDDLSRLRPTLEAHLAGDTPQYESEFRMRHKDGRWLWILDRGKVVARDAEGRPLRAVGTHVDITARREAEEALREALAANERLVAELREAAHKIKTLTGFIPICMFCKKIRDDHGYWERLEAYISAHSDARFSHGLCPECQKEHYGDL